MKSRKSYVLFVSLAFLLVIEPAQADDVLNRKLITTHFFTNSGASFPAECQVAGCATGLELIGPNAIKCPRGSSDEHLENGQRSGFCTFEIEVCSQVTINTASVGDALFFRFLVDGFASPVSPGPVTNFGEYTVEQPLTVSANTLISRCASVVDTKNTLGTHSLSVAIDARDLVGDGASITAGSSKVTVRVYKP